MWRANTPGFDSAGYRTQEISQRLIARDRFEIFLGAILTQNTAWKNVAATLPALLAAGIDSPQALLEYPAESLSQLIRPSGYYNQKAKKLRFACEFFSREGSFETGCVPKRDELLGLWGIGPETADSILLYAFNYPIFVVDAYTKRLFTRLGIFSQEADYISLQNGFQSALPLDPSLFNEYHALIVACCKFHCASRPQCAACPLRQSCAYYRELAPGLGEQQ